MSAPTPTTEKRPRRRSADGSNAPKRCSRAAVKAAEHTTRTNAQRMVEDGYDLLGTEPFQGWFFVKRPTTAPPAFDRDGVPLTGYHVNVVAQTCECPQWASSYAFNKQAFGVCKHLLWATEVVSAATRLFTCQGSYLSPTPLPAIPTIHTTEEQYRYELRSRERVSAPCPNCGVLDEVVSCFYHVTNTKNQASAGYVTRHECGACGYKHVP